MDTYELQNALYAREVASAYYLGNPRVTLIDVGMKITDGVYTGEMAVRVHLRKKPPEAVIEAMRATLPELVIDKSKIPFDKVDLIEATYPLDRSWWTPWPASPRAATFNPLHGGISLSGEWIFGYGTLGGIVEDRQTGAKMILSNWHVLAGSEFGVPGTRIFQPGYGDYGRGPDTVALLTRHAFDQGIDAAVATLNGARDWSNNQLGIGPVTGCGTPVMDMRVIKSGRASGVTRGVIDGFAGEYPITYHGVLRSIKHVCRIVPQPGELIVSQPGDSGSMWLEQVTHQAVGLHFAGQDDPETALAIALPEVFAALDVNFPGGSQPHQPESAEQPAAAPQERALAMVRG